MVSIGSSRIGVRRVGLVNERGCMLAAENTERKTSCYSSAEKLWKREEAKSSLVMSSVGRALLRSLPS